MESTIPHTPRRVAFPGEPGAFSEEAVLALWPDATLIPTRTVPDVTRAIARGEVEAGVVPVENTVAGTVVPAYDALGNAPELHVIAESILEVRQFLLAIPSARLDDIEVVESHPVALAQCSAFLRRLSHAKERVAADTASAARAVAESRDPRRAAIASRHAAARYGLAILASHIEDRADNQTRFLALARTPARVEADTPARTSVVFTTANEPGALIRALEPIAHHGLNLSKLESRPTGEPWTYRFFADIDHVGGDSRLDAALSVLSQATRTCRTLGTYARASTVSAKKTR